MRRLRFHLGTLVMLIVFLAVGLAALREANEIWDSSIFCITMGILLISILLAVHRTESRRAFWMGFCLFGWIYLGLSLVPSIESRLITTKVLHYVDLKRIPITVGGFAYFDYDNDGSMDLYVVNNTQPNAVIPRVLLVSSRTTENFLRIGHSLVALIMALLGGHLSRRLCNDNREALHKATASPGSTSS